jgi:KDO2-lipid IV(A) lauroyltransferase
MPATEAARLHREVVFQDLVAALGWSHLLHLDATTYQRDFATVVIEDDAILAQLARDRRPIILSPLHMGAYALPFARIMHDYFRNRPMLILRAREDRPEETRAMQRIAELGIDMRFLNIANKQSFLDAIRFARNGAVIVCFGDLPGSYGSPCETTLFGHPAELAMGLGSLARVAEATVLPVAVYSDVSGDRVVFGKPFQSFRTGDDERHRVAGLITRHLETSIAADPAQWHMWPRIGEYLKPIMLEEAAA